MEQRRSKRVPFQTACRLIHDSVEYDCRTSNISVSGAMISFEDSVMIPTGDQCSLMLLLSDQEPIGMKAKVIYSTMFNLGLQFLEMNEAVTARVADIVTSVEEDSR